MPNKLTNQEFIIKANNAHNNKYIYVEEYKGANIKIKIECPSHGLFEQTPHNHINGKNGCPICGIENSQTKRRSTIEKFIEEANKIHNYKYSYTNEYINAHTKIEIVCSIHGLFKQTPDKHLQGHGCMKCGIGKNVSQKEIIWLDSLNIPEEYRQFILKLGNKKIKVDGFDPITKTIYEYYGDYWHGNPKIFDPIQLNNSVKKTFGELYQNTIDRELFIQKYGYKIISLWENKGINE